MYARQSAPTPPLGRPSKTFFGFCHRAQGCRLRRQLSSAHKRGCRQTTVACCIRRETNTPAIAKTLGREIARQPQDRTRPRPEDTNHPQKIYSQIMPTPLHRPTPSFLPLITDPSNTQSVNPPIRQSTNHQSHPSILLFKTNTPSRSGYSVFTNDSECPSARNIQLQWLRRPFCFVISAIGRAEQGNHSSC